jgi:isopenicillin N synthase-like dioxygenase
MTGIVKDGDVAGLADLADFNNRQVDRKALTSLPIIDLSPFVEGAPLDERRRVAGELRRANIDIGFFYLTGHGISQQELDEVIRWGHRFWALPLEERMKLHKGANAGGLGYVPAGAAAYSDKSADTREIFSVSRELVPGEPEAGRLSAGKSQWPDPQVLPGFETFLKAHLVKRLAVTRHLLHAFALSLELPETYFDEAHRFLNCNLIFNYYPPVDPATTDRNKWGISPHTDYGTFTLLSQDGLGGLEIRNSKGDWITAPPVPGAFVVNIGDLFARWTNDLYISTLHRAVALDTSKGARISVPLFVIPQGMVEIACLETCQGPDNPPKYEPVKAGEYVRALIEQSRRTGRAGISEQTANRFKATEGKP